MSAVQIYAIQRSAFASGSHAFGSHTYRYGMVSWSSPAVSALSLDLPSTASLDPDPSPLVAKALSISVTTSFPARVHCSFPLLLVSRVSISVIFNHRQGFLEVEEDDLLLVFPNSLTVLVEAVGHEYPHGDEVVCWAESAGGEVALRFG